MPEINYGLTDFRQVILKGDGSGTVSWTPINSNWTIRSLAVTGASPLTPVARFYIGFIGRQYYRDGTSAGNGDLTDTQYDLRDGITMIVEWTGGTPGAQMTATITYDATVTSEFGFRARA